MQHSLQGVAAPTQHRARGHVSAPHLSGCCHTPSSQWSSQPGLESCEGWAGAQTQSSLCPPWHCTAKQSRHRAKRHQKGRPQSLHWKAQHELPTLLNSTPWTRRYSAPRKKTAIRAPKGMPVNQQSLVIHAKGAWQGIGLSRSPPEMLPVRGTEMPTERQKQACRPLPKIRGRAPTKSRGAFPHLVIGAMAQLSVLGQPGRQHIRHCYCPCARSIGLLCWFRYPGSEVSPARHCLCFTDARKQLRRGLHVCPSTQRRCRTGRNWSGNSLDGVLR